MAGQDSWGKIPDQPVVAQQRSAAQEGFDSWSDAARLATMGQEQAPAQAQAPAPVPAPTATPQGPPQGSSPGPTAAGPAPSSVPPSPGTSATPSPLTPSGWALLGEDQSALSGRVTRRTTTEWMLLPSGVGVLYRTTVQDADAGGAISTSTAQTFVPSPAPADGVLERIATLLDRITVLAERQQARDEAQEQAVEPPAVQPTASAAPPKPRSRRPTSKG